MPQCPLCPHVPVPRPGLPQGQPVSAHTCSVTRVGRRCWEACSQGAVCRCTCCVFDELPWKWLRCAQSEGCAWWAHRWHGPWPAWGTTAAGAVATGQCRKYWRRERGCAVPRSAGPSAPTAASLLGGLECFTREVLPRAVLTVVGCVWQETKFWFCFF